MKTSKAIEILQNIKNGTFGVVEYETELPVNKEAKQAGIKIYCKTKKMVRFGASYKNLIDEVASAEVKPHTNNYSWKMENKIAYNSKTEKDYLRISNINRKTISKEYCMVTPDLVAHSKNLDNWKGLFRPSFFNVYDYRKPVVQNISIENIISINGIN